MNNKKIGSDFEKKFTEHLNDLGYWVHFLEPSRSGAQPFDVIAVKDKVAYAFDCKTCVRKSFSINRLEDNQIMAFERWIDRGNTIPYVAVEHEGKIFLIRYDYLKEKESIKLGEDIDYEFCSIEQHCHDAN